jgi:hypothetical protein
VATGVDPIPAHEGQDKGFDTGQDAADVLGLLDGFGDRRAPDDLHDVETLHAA